MVGLVVLLAASPLMGSCGKACTTAGCRYTLRINFVGQSSWESGTWDIVIEESNTEVGSCSIELPTSSPTSNSTCTKTITLEQTDDGRGVSSLEVIHEFNENSQVGVSVRRNGEQVAQSTLSPDFQPA
jgi:hypothetical protein